MPRTHLLRPYPQFRAVYALQPSAGKRRYQSVVQKLEKKFREGFGGRVNYTWSGTKDNLLGEGSDVTRNPGELSITTISTPSTGLRSPTLLIASTYPVSSSWPAIQMPTSSSASGISQPGRPSDLWHSSAVGRGTPPWQAFIPRGLGRGVDRNRDAADLLPMRETYPSVVDGYTSFWAPGVQPGRQMAGIFQGLRPWPLLGSGVSEMRLLNAPETFSLPGSRSTRRSDISSP